MRLGTVQGAVWATRKAESLQGQTLLRVLTSRGELIAADLVGAGPGDRVLLTLGAGAGAALAPMPVDAVIVGILDETEALHEL